MSAATAGLVFARPIADTDRLARLGALLRPEFLTEAGWDAETQVLAPPREHPLLGLRKCAVVDCEAGVRTPNTDLCKLCVERFKTSGIPMGQFTTIACGKIAKGEQWCRITGCQRPSHLRVRLCHNHYSQWRKANLPIEQFAALPDIKPFGSFGPCRVASCVRSAVTGQGICQPHRTRWNAGRRQATKLAFADWLRIAEPINVDHLVIFKGVSEQAQLELLVGLQQRTAAGVRTLLTALRPIVTALRQAEARSLDDLDEAAIKQTRHDAALLAGTLATTVRRALASPETERVKDVWDLTSFGLTGNISFIDISQPWLREISKRWVEDDLPKHRGRQAASTAKTVVRAISGLSTSLRLARDDQGNRPDALSRRDIIAFTNRLAHQQRTGQMTELMRLRATRYARRFLVDVRAMGLTRPGGPAAGLPDDFLLSRADIPAQPDEDGAGRDLPPWVLRVINDNLHVLEERSGADSRRMVELLIDTGRRPDEICQLPWDCLRRDDANKPVLVYADSKNNKPGLRLPIAEATAQILADQQDDVRHRFTSTPVDRLVLFPRDRTNPAGTETYSEQVFTNTHRQFINAIDDRLVTTVTGHDGRQRQEVFDRLKVVPYAYRHSYAQRHADEGVAPDVLRDLMDTTRCKPR